MVAEWANSEIVKRSWAWVYWRKQR